MVRLVKFAIIAASLILGLWIILNRQYNAKTSLGNSDQGIVSSSRDRDGKPLVGGHIQTGPLQKYWARTMEIMALSSPHTARDNIIILNHKQDIGDVKTKEALLARSLVSSETIEEIRSKHQLYVRTMPNHLPYEKDTKGIVFIGGGKFSWLMYLSLMGLRDTGCKLPVEVIMPTYADYENELYFCKKVLPKLNAKCVVIPEVMGDDAMLHIEEKFKSYQFKSLALMVSSFQHVLLLDSDNVALDNPEFIFNSKVYKKYGMITWPDYWQRTTSPLFYHVANKHVDEFTRVRFDSFPMTPVKLTQDQSKKTSYHEFAGTMVNPSTESGQFVINKKTHSKTLLLSMYYNVYGIKAYYRLLSLGETGEGDKDTFVAAAHVLNEPYYQVLTNVRALGYFGANGFSGVAMMQRNPQEDFESFEKNFANVDVNGKSVQEIENLYEKFDNEFFSANNDIPYLFMHCNFPKLEPNRLMDTSVFDPKANRLGYRMFSGFKYERGVLAGKDFELQMWTNMKKAICEDEIPFINFERENMQRLCDMISNEVSWLVKNPV